MPLSLEKKQKASLLKTIGIKSTKKPAIVGPKFLVDNNASSLQFHKNKQGSYDLNNLPFESQIQGNLFDGKELILSWSVTDNQDLNLDIKCSLQVNLWAPLQFKNVSIGAKGPLYLGNDIDCANNLTIKAQSLAVDNPVNCGHRVVVEAKQGVAFLAPLVCKSANVCAGIIYQLSTLETKEQIDFICADYRSTHQSKLLSPALRLIADSAELGGKVRIAKQCFMTANQLFFGNPAQKTKLLLMGKNYIKADDLSSVGSTQVLIKGNKQETIIDINNYFKLASESVFNIDNATLNFNKATVAGCLNCSQSELSLNDLRNSGEIFFQQGNLVINQAYTAEEGGLLKLREAHALVNENLSIDGTTEYSKSAIVGKKLAVLSGELSISEGSTLCLTDKLNLSKGASFKLADSDVNVAKAIAIRGSINLNQATIKAPVLTLENERFQGKDFIFFSSEHLRLSGTPNLVNGGILANDLTIDDQIKLDNAQIQTQRLKVNADKGLFSKLHLNTIRLDISGGTEPEDVSFIASNMTAEHFSSHHHMTLKDSILNLTDKDNYVQSVGEGVSLNNSRVISQTPILQEQGSKLSLQNHSQLSAPEIFSEGELTSDFSEIFAKCLTQIQGAFTTTNSHLNIDESLTVIQSDVTLANNSNCVIPTVNFLNHSKVNLSEKSAILAKKILTTDKTSQISSKDSNVVARKMDLIGQYKLDHGSLTTEALRIYDEFDASQSEVNAGSLVAASKNSVMTMNDSKLQTTDMQTAGQLSLSDAQLRVDKKLILAPESNTTIKSKSVLMSNHLAVLGEMHVPKDNITKNKPLDDKEPKEVAALLLVKDKLILTAQAKIEGDGPLVVEANEFSNFGSVKLDNSFVSKGGLFKNHGHFEADTLYLGYDDAVVNTGSMSAHNMTVQSNFINPFGRVYVKEAMNCSGFFGANLGLICANNYSNTTLISSNLAVILPNFSANLGHIFSKSNVWSVGNTALTAAMPGYANMTNLPSMGLGIYQSIRSGYKLWKSTTFDNFKPMKPQEWVPYLYKQINFDSLKQMRRHEWMPYLGQLYSFITVGTNALTRAYRMGGQVSGEIKNLREKGLSSGFVTPKWNNLGLKVASNFVNSYRDTSLIHLNAGLSLSGNSTFSNLLHANAGLETSLVFHTLNTQQLHNRGFSEGTESAYSAHKIMNGGQLGGLTSFSMSAHQLMNAHGKVAGPNASMQIDECQQEGDMAIDGGMLHIKHFNGKKAASSSFKNTVLIGETFDDKGPLSLENTLLSYSKRFEVDEAAQTHSKNVAIESEHFINKGQWNYEDLLQVRAKKTLLGEEGYIKGKQSEEKDLFVEKETTPEDNNETNTEDNKKVFKPQHVFTLQTKELGLNGKLLGGDYTQVQGLATEGEETQAPNKCDLIKLGEKANVDLKYGSIASKAFQVDGIAKLDKFNLNIDSTKINPQSGELLQTQSTDKHLTPIIPSGGQLKLTQTQFTGRELTSRGQFDLEKTVLDMTGAVVLSKEAREQMKDSTIKAGSLVDHSQMGIEGRVGVQTSSYQHEGHISSTTSDEKDAKSKDSLFNLESKTAKLAGSSNLKKAIYNIENFDDAEALLKGEGQYSRYQFSEHLGVNVDREINLTGPVNRQCGLFAKGRSVKADLNYRTAYDLTFVSTQGDVSLRGNMDAGNIYGQSAQAMYTSALMHAAKVLHLKAEGKFENYGTLNGNQVAIKAASILNANENKSGGVINGRDNTFLEATAGNIENQGGMIRGGKYIQLIAKGDVINACKVGSHSNGFATVYDFEGGLIAGGTGEATNNVGLYIKANGKVISDASNFTSGGTNYIEGDKGNHFGERHQTYISNVTTKRKWYGKREKTVHYTDQVVGSTVHSAHGRNIIVTDHGGVDSVATQFSSPLGTQISALNEVKLYSIKTRSGSQISTSSLWGLNKNTKNKYDENATPTLFVDNGKTTIVSKERSIDARGALFMGGGDLEMKAKHRIKFGCDVLEHEVTEKKRGVGVSVPGLQTGQALLKGHWLDAATAEDATLAKIKHLADSKNTADILSSAANLGVDLYNTSSSVMRGLANEDMSGELLARYGLGGAEGFSPAVTISMAESKTTTKFQTLGAGGVNRGGDIQLTAGEGVDLENGVKVHAGGKIDVDAPELIQRAAKLNASVDQKTRTESVTINLSGEVQDVAYSQSKTRADAANYVNSELSAGDNIRLHHGDKAINVVLDGGNIKSKTLDANIKHLTIIDKQDTLTSKTTAAGASASGNISFKHGKTTSKTTKQQSGIHVEEGINNNGHSVHVGEAYMEGGKITSNGKNDIAIDHLTAVELHDETHTNVFGAGININDVARLTGQQQSTNQTGEKAIATGTLGLDYTNYEAKQSSVIHGDQGSDIKISQLDGNVHTESADGKSIINNKEVHLEVDIPLTNSSYLQSANQNFKAGAAKLQQLLGDTSSPDEIDPPFEEIPEEIIEEDGPELNESIKDEAKVEDDIVTVEDANNKELDNEKESIEDEVLESSIPSIGGNFNEKAELESKTHFPTAETEESDKDKAHLIAATDMVAKSSEFKGKVKEVDEYKRINDQKHTKKSEKELKKAIQQCVLLVMQEAVSQGVDLSKKYLANELAHQVEKAIGSSVKGLNLQTQVYLGSKGLVISLAFNLGIAALDSNVDRNAIMKEAVSQTAADYILGVAIKTAGLGAGFSWGLVGLSVVDKLFYDENVVNDLIDSSVSDFKGIQDSKNFLERFGRMQIADGKMRIATQLQAGHLLASVNDYIASGIQQAWDHLPSFGNKASSPLDAVSSSLTSSREDASGGAALTNSISSTVEKEVAYSKDTSLPNNVARLEGTWIPRENTIQISKEYSKKVSPKGYHQNSFFSANKNKFKQAELAEREALQKSLPRFGIK